MPKLYFRKIIVMLDSTLLVVRSVHTSVNLLKTSTVHVKYLQGGMKNSFSSIFNVL
jgi:hypothetical protein